MGIADELWGGELVSVAFDPVTWTLRLGVKVSENDQERRYELVVDDVYQWHSARETPLPWNYAELTEAHISEGEDRALVELVLWSDGNSLSASGSRVQLVRMP